MVLGCLANTIAPYGTKMFIKKIFLPRLPHYIIDQIYESIKYNLDAWNKVDIPSEYDKFTMYNWLPANELIQDWCKSNISPDLYWGVQVIDENLPMHKDHGTQIKFNYIIDQGGINVKTNYYDDEGTLLDSYIMEDHEWYILDVSKNHSVTDVISGQKRISITSRIIP